MNPKLKLLTLAIAASSAGLLPEAAVAQGASLTLEEVFVTARRRDEALQDVPIAVSAFNPQQIERLKMERPEDLQFQTPSLMITGSGSETLQLGIRGQFVNDALGTTDAPVNVYFGEALISRPMGTNRSMFDLASIQVLKGVQGTLFGRNSTGGALIIQPASPSNALEGSLSASVGNYKHRQ
jgi:iron complex outermembrane receptor protein